VEKGFDLVLRTFEAAREEGLDVRLRLAGPTRSAVEARMLANVLKRHGGRVHYVGPVYGVDKEAFYNAIDLVLFPTRYRNEADPLVLLEALDHGVPVIAYSRGCIQEHVPAEAGCVVDADEDFSERALAVIRDYVSSPAKLDRASEDAIRYVPKMRDRAHADLEGVLSAIGSL
jgi:glycosyltransferase involved in cell wall biosynthesis